MRKFWAVVLLVIVFLAILSIVAVADGPATWAGERTTTEIMADVDARVAAFAAGVEARGVVRRAVSLIRVNARLAEIWAMRTMPLLEHPGTWQSRPEHLFR